ncbi:MAG: hypothetical protein HRU06_14780 [Oceanospirillaceae bacterium]|nr:hypothetical protein [Oceanospirillaceae bacterium]
MIKRHKLLYCLPKPYRFRHSLLAGVQFKNQWLTIKNGTLTIATHYAWDGCTPKYTILGLFTIGIPDGTLRNGLPWLYHPSLVHDVLCQFRHQLPFTQQQVTQIFNDHLHAVNWPLTTLYTTAVTLLGPQDF